MKYYRSKPIKIQMKETVLITRLLKTTFTRDRLQKHYLGCEVHFILHSLLKMLSGTRLFYRLDD